MVGRPAYAGWAPAERPADCCNLTAEPNGARLMADYVGSTSLDIEQLNGLSARLIDHADGIENITASALEQDRPSWHAEGVLRLLDANKMVMRGKDGRMVRQVQVPGFDQVTRPHFV